MALFLACWAFVLPASAQQLDLFGAAATTTMTSTATGLFTQQSVGQGAVTATLDGWATTGTTPVIVDTSNTATTDTYTAYDGTATANVDYYVRENNTVTLQNSASNVLNQFSTDSSAMTSLLGTGVTLANGEIAIAQQALAEGTTDANMNLPSLEPSDGSGLSNIVISNSAIGAGNVITLPTSPLSPP
jgi:hypothetical protein